MATLNLGRVGPFFRGAWTGGTEYKILDVVRYAGGSWKCEADHTADNSASGNQPGTTAGAALWLEIVGGIDYVGTWNNATTYRTNQIVTSGSSSYIAMQSTINQNPADNPAVWNIIASGFGSWRDTYTDVNIYAPGDIVFTNGSAFIATTTTTAGDSPVDDVSSAARARWDVLVAGIEFYGEWQPSTYYPYRSTVIYNGGAWIVYARSGAAADTVPPDNSAYWKQASDGQAWKGGYSDATVYYPDAIVRYRNAIYICTQKTAAGENPEATTAKWDVLVGTGWNQAGTWQSGQNYYINDIVTDGGGVYRAKVNNIDQKPSTDNNNTYWETWVHSPANLEDFDAADKVLRLKGLTSAENNNIRANRELVAIVDGSGNATGDLVIHDGLNVGGAIVGGLLQTAGRVNDVPASFTLTASTANNNPYRLDSSPDLSVTLTAKKANSRFRVSCRIFGEVTSPYDCLLHLGMRINGVESFPNLPPPAGNRNRGLSIGLISYHFDNASTPEMWYFDTMFTATNNKSDVVIFYPAIVHAEGNVFYINRTAGDTSSSGNERGSSEIIVQELL